MFEKTVISPVLAVLYLAVSITGTLLFCHIDGRVLMSLHEWAGIFFVLTGSLHLCLNWKVFKVYLKRTKGIAAMGGAVVACLFFILLDGFDDHAEIDELDSPSDIPLSRYED